MKTTKEAREALPVKRPTEALDTVKGWDQRGYTLQKKSCIALARTADDRLLFGSESVRKRQPTRNYAYDVTPKSHLPQMDLPYVREQLGLARGYRNELVSIERRRRKLALKIAQRYNPALVRVTALVDGKQAEINQIRSAISKSNQRTRAKTATEEQQEQLDTLYDQLRTLYTEQRQEANKAYRHPDYPGDRIQSRADRRTKAARKKFSGLGLYSMTYVAVERWNGLTNGDIRKGPPPRFTPWDGSGSLCARMQGKPMDWLIASRSKDKRLRVRTEGKFTIVSIRLGSKGKGNREPIWVDCPIVMDRPLPPGSIIKEVLLSCQRVGQRLHYKVVFSIEMADGFPSKQPRATRGTVAVNPGYRKTEKGLRVAYWVGSDGREGELIIPRDTVPHYDRRRKRHYSAGSLAYMEKVTDIKSIRDKAFDVIVPQLMDFWRDREIMPDWAKDTAPYLHKINSQARIVGFFRQWEENRIPGDNAIFATLKEWVCKKELHLERWESAARAKFYRWRNQYYREFWAGRGEGQPGLCSQYKYLIIGKVDQKRMNAKAKPEEASKVGLASAERGMAANAKLIEYGKEKYGYIKETMPGDVIEKDCAYISLDCPCCHHRNDKPNHNRKDRQCEECGREWDQDRAACVNLLASGEVVNQNPATSRNGENQAQQGVIVWEGNRPS